MQRAHERLHGGEVVHEKRAVVAALGDALRAAEVQVDVVAHAAVHVARGAQQHLGVVCAKLDEEGPVGGAGGEVLGAVGGGLGEEARVHHGRVGGRGAVLAAEHAEGQLGLQRGRCVAQAEGILALTTLNAAARARNAQTLAQPPQRSAS